MPGNRMDLEERQEIALGLAREESFRAIAQALCRPCSTVSREVGRHGGRGKYRSAPAQRESERSARRPKECKLVARRWLARRVEAGLLKKWSPQQIAAGLRTAQPDDPQCRVSHETIYRSLYLQGRGGLRKELTKALRTGRARRRPFKPASERGKQGSPRDMVLISERPAEIEDRALPGHWEGDLIIGRNGKSQLGTLVERVSRVVLLVRLPEGRSAWMVRKALMRKIRHLPNAVFRSITWDQGREMAEHLKFTFDTGIQIYFCDPHSPWQRGSNENTNGLLRQFFPKGTDLSHVTAAELRRVEDLMNGRPRKTLDWMTPSEKFAQIVATAA